MTDIVDGNIPGLFIGRNPVLADIEQLQKIESIDGTLNIQRNPELCLPSWIYDIDVSGGRYLSNNKSTGCS